ncbi:Uncharacterized protein SCF082_LOCUS41059 [Durusdinium trenchii]|uniref:FACT complex subunit n=1 Tax=Durusdinium trenchii TaxID=1381693 RepID=A0ABP0QGN9_9DINO
MALWNDFRQKPVCDAPADDALQKADSKLEALSVDARRKAWEHDTLQLARDVASLGRLLAASQQSQKAERMKKIMNMRSENTIGGSIIEDFMNRNACHRAGTEVDLLTITDQFVAARKPTGAAGTTGFIVWADMTKFGRMDNKQRNFATAIIHKVLSRNPTTAIAIVLAPHLTSEKVSGGHRGEIRRIEDKLDGRSLANMLITLRMESPPSSKRVSLNMFGWLVWAEGSWDENVFKECELAQLRSPRATISWLPETSYIVPISEKDGLPHASEGMRSLSDVQEAAQLLAGKAVPIQLLQSVLSKTKLKQAAVVNATPYDCYLEKVCLEYHKDHDVSLAHLSVSLSPSLVDYVQKVLAMELLQAWKKGDHCVGEVRAYNPTPPPTDSEIDVASYNFKVVQVTVDNRKVGWDRFQVKLPAEVRASYYRDIVYGAEWRALMKDFDQRFDKSANPAAEIPRAPEPEKGDVEQLNWDGEPATIEDLMHTYQLEAKGAHMEIEITTEEIALSHGTSRFKACSKVADLMRKKRSGQASSEPTKRSISFDPEVKKIPTEKSSSGDAELPLSAQQLTSKNNPALKSELVKELEGKIAAAKARAKNDQKNMRLAEIKGGEQPTRGRGRPPKAKAKASKKKSKRESSSNSLDSEEPLSDEYDQDECDDEDDDEDLPKESKEKAAKPTTKTEAEKKTSKKTTTKPEPEEDPSKAKRPKKAAKIEQQKPTRQAFLKEAAKEFPNEPNTKKRKAKVQPTGNESAAESREKTSTERPSKRNGALKKPTNTEELKHAAKNEGKKEKEQKMQMMSREQVKEPKERPSRKATPEDQASVKEDDEKHRSKEVTEKVKRRPLKLIPAPVEEDEEINGSKKRSNEPEKPSKKAKRQAKGDEVEENGTEKKRCPRRSRVKEEAPLEATEEVARKCRRQEEESKMAEEREAESTAETEEEKEEDEETARITFMMIISNEGLLHSYSNSIP